MLEVLFFRLIVWVSLFSLPLVLFLLICLACVTDIRVAVETADGEETSVMAVLDRT